MARETVLATARKYDKCDDDDLVRRSIDGDETAKSALVSRYLPRMWRIAYLNCGASADVEDLVQTAMMTALENLPAYRGPNRFKYWLDRLTVNVIRSHFRKTKLRRLFSQGVDVDQTSVDHPLGELRRLEAQELFQRLGKHVARIGEKNRMALVLSVMHGYRASEIAEMTGCSIEAAWKRTRRGYDELMNRVSRDVELDRSLRELFYE